MRHPLFFLTLALATVFSFSYGKVAKAQITPDNTLGAENSRVTQDVIKGTPSDKIDGGAIRGDNLFHSFQEFNVNAGRGAYFSNPAGIANILTRVTGGNVSNIQGVLGVLGKANLFLINPNGIIFGPNARLDVGGSFLGSTANSLIFKDGFEFSATNPQTRPLLTITAPVGLSYRENFKNITTQSTTNQYPILQVPEGNTITLVGGNVSLDRPDLLAPGGRVELGGLSAPGTVGLNSDGSLSFPVGVQRGDVSLTNVANVDVSSGKGGSITVNARNLNISGGSGLYAGIRQGLGTVGSQAGNITLDATGDIKVVGSYVFNTVEPGGVGNGGNININAATLSLTDGAQLQTLVRQASFNQPGGRGDAGDVTVNVTGKVTIAGFKGEFRSGIFSVVGQGATGKGGNITISSGSLSLTDGAQLDASTFGQGDAGTVWVQASDSVSLDNEAKLYARVRDNAVGNGGNITIKTGSFSAARGSELEVSTKGQGTSGNIRIEAKEFSLSSNAALIGDVGSQGKGGGNIDLIVDGSVSLTGGKTQAETAPTGESTRITLGVQQGGKGSGGNLTINANSLVLKDGAFIKASTQGEGDAGNININTNIVDISGSSPTSGLVSGLFTSSDTSFKGGNIIINTQTFQIADSAALSARTLGDGQGGNITVNAESFEASNGGQLITTTTGKGPAGNIFINAKDRVTISGIDQKYDTRITRIQANEEGIRQSSSNPENASFQLSLIANNITQTGAASGLFANTLKDSTGKGGSIEINTGQFIVQDRSQVDVSSEGKGNAGNLFVNARSIIRLDNNSTISANTAVGEQGNINLSARDYVLLRRGSKITTNATGTATGGNITINAGNLVAFPLENSDITANAEESFGGRININVKGGIFGIEYRPRQTPLSDITVRSSLGPQFSGTVRINTPEIDPTQGLFELTETVVDPAQQVAQNPCVKGFGNSFTITGRGGLPTDPQKVLSSDNVRVDLIQPVPSTVSLTTPTKKQPSQKPPVKQIIPAQGWIYNEKGQVVLVGYDPTKTGPQREQPAPTSNCAAVK